MYAQFISLSDCAESLKLICFVVFLYCVLLLECRTVDYPDTVISIQTALMCSLIENNGCGVLTHTKCSQFMLPLIIYHFSL